MGISFVHILFLTAKWNSRIINFGSREILLMAVSSEQRIAFQTHV
jgi:hypothetical protein